MRFTRWQASRAVLAALAMAGVLAAAGPAAAQDEAARVRKLEDQVRALQRKVFPGPDGKFFAPEVDTSNNQPVQQQQPVGIPAATPLTDLLGRLDSIEAQLNRLTARSEVNENAISMIEDRLDKLEAAGAPATAAVPVQPTGAIEVPDAGPPAVAAKNPAKTNSPTRPAAPSAARLAKVQAVAKPDTGNAGDDEYSYGFRLWEAGLYPEAQQQLKLYVDKYPNDPKISYGRNLLGRAYLDDKQPKAAAPYFLENYQKDPNGARAPDSLLFLAEAMVALKDNTRACRALAEFSDKYPALATGRLQDQYDRDRKQAGCK
uniref:tetratricopeptide repeat protein n=1 Tax=Altererythrobacter segetis TaxID=1104773 RepID=UPI001FAF799A|nr:tetratricopeptide repeat protein [Altererythrobacter segetis]